MNLFESATALTFVYFGVLAAGLIMVVVSWIALARSFTAGSQTQAAAAPGRALAQSAALSLGVAVLVFGAVGLLTERALGLAPTGSILWSLAAGLLAGFITQFILTRQFNRRVAQEEAAGYEVVGRVAEVIIPIPADGLGEIVVAVDAEPVHLGARSAGGEPIERGARVIIDRVSHRVAIVRTDGAPPVD